MKLTVSARKRQHHLKRVLVGIMIFLLTFSILSMIASAVIFRTFFGRIETVPETLELHISDVDSKQYPFREIQFPSGENLLHGYLCGTDNQNGLIILISGAGGGAESHLAEMMYFVDHGWAVLAYDGTGVRSSEGAGTRGLSQAKCDALAAIAFASEAPETAGLPIVLYGHSIGGYAAATALDSSEISGAVSIAAFNSPVETMYYFAKQHIGVLADAGYPFLCLQNYLTFGKDADTSALDTINSVDKPVMIVYGTNDTVIPEELSIYSHREQITNPEAVFLSVTEDGRSSHSTAWLTADAAQYAKLCRTRLEALQEEYNGEIPPQELQTFFDSVNYTRLYELDEEFMAQVLDFCSAAVARAG